MIVALALAPGIARGGIPVRRAVPVGDAPPPPAAVAAGAGEDEAKNVARALEDLRSDDVETRVGAAILLGKYPGDLVERGLAGALRDREVRVRRAAVVSLLERQGEGLVPATLVSLVNALGDADVEVRRAISSNASALVGRLMMTRLRLGVLPAPGGSAAREPARAPVLPVELQVRLLASLRDPDAVVRRNVVRQYPALEIDAPAPYLVALMSDSDAEVRLAALPLAAAVAAPAEFASRAARLIDGATVAWKLALVREIAQRPAEQTLELLGRLARDPDRDVALEAEIARFESAPAYDPGVPLAKMLEGGQLTGELGARVVRMYALLSKVDAERATEPLLGAADDSVRAEAISVWLVAHEGGIDEGRAEAFLGDRSPAVRDRVTRLMRRRIGDLPPGLPTRLARSDRPELRRGAFSLARGLESGAAAEVLEELLLDGEEEVRLAALEEYSRRKMEGWREILESTLGDPSDRVRSFAARLLIGLGGEEGRAAVERVMGRGARGGGASPGEGGGGRP